ncbi:putative transposase [Ustilago hordei]|uniref:putative transposase n=1 Tax=Ustilago hordei TaxID=120017 RepID=UPI001A3FA061|nr:putative transposase [Ustilago hordei]SYW83056.1 probable transposase [Ustilago hordei]
MPKTTPERCQLALFHIQNGESTHSVAEQLAKAPLLMFQSQRGASWENSSLVMFASWITILSSIQPPWSGKHVMHCRRHFKSKYAQPQLVKKPQRLKRHYKAHFKFANEHKDMTVEDWKKVVWSDEMKINFFGLDGKQFCWIKNASFNSKLVRLTVKFGSSSIMIWGCMTWEGVGGMHLVLGSMNSDQYIDILNDKLLKTISDLQLQHAYTDIMFQQDNDLKHMSKKTITWLESNSIKYSMIAKSRDELLKRCEAEWTVITPETCRTLIESMPDHIKVVLKAKGGNTKY